MAEYTPVYQPGIAFTSQASAAITGGQLVAVTGSGTVGPSGASTASVVGIAANDAASGAKVTVYTVSGGIHEVTTAAIVTAGQTLESAAAGTVTPHTNGTNDAYIIGVAITSAASGAKVRFLASR